MFILGIRGECVSFLEKLGVLPRDHLSLGNNSGVEERGGVGKRRDRGDGA